MASGNLSWNITQGVGQLQEMGFFNFLLPFGIFFAILFGILDKYKIVSKEKNVNALLAALISGFVLLYAYVNELEWFFAIFYTRMATAIMILLFAATMAVFVFRALKENEVIPAGRENVWSAVLIMASTMIIHAAFINAPEPMGTWAMNVSSIVLGLATLGAILSFFITGKAAGGGGGGEE